MPKVYVRTQPKTGLKIRHRCAIGFTDVWKEIDVDDATRAALEEDPYLEVSDTPTVLVEVAAVIETEQDPNNTPESDATNEGSTGAIAAEGADTGTAAPVANEESNDEQNPTAGDAVNDAAVDTAAVDSSTAQDSTELPAAETLAAVAEEAVVVDPRMDAIKAAIAQLDPNNVEQWLSDGKPVIDAVSALTGFKVLAAERDQAWNQIKAQAVAG